MKTLSALLVLCGGVGGFPSQRAFNWEFWWCQYCQLRTAVAETELCAMWVPMTLMWRLGTATPTSLFVYQVQGWLRITQFWYHHQHIRRDCTEIIITWCTWHICAKPMCACLYVQRVQHMFVPLLDMGGQWVNFYVYTTRVIRCFVNCNFL